MLGPADAGKGGPRPGILAAKAARKSDSVDAIAYNSQLFRPSDALKKAINISPSLSLLGKEKE